MNPLQTNSKKLLGKMKRLTKAWVTRVRAPKKPSLSAGDLDFISDSREAILSKTTPIARYTLLIIAAFFLTALTWAHFAVLDEVTRASGKVVPSSQVQVIQNLEGGILSSINVSEGENVKKGQVLMQLDDTRFASNYREKQIKYQTLLASTARLQAEAAGKESIDFPKELDQNPEIKAQETNIFNTRKQGIEHAIANLSKGYALAKHELDITAPLAKKGVISKVELLRLQREVNDLKSKLDQQEDQFKEEAEKKLAQNKAEEASLAENLLALRDRMVRTTVRSPIAGVVKQIHIATIGGVIKPGMDLMEIVPLNDKLLVETQVRPTDIAFIHPGQNATVKISAYDYAIYGGLKGRVKFISADTSLDKKGNSFYEVDIQTHKNYLGATDNKHPIIPGMTASVDILTGKKTVLTYLLKPILRAQHTALRER